jgi:hypothetical protein
MIIVVGDVHAEWELFDRNILQLTPPEVPIIQVGDLGAWPSQTPTFSRSFDFVEGNHDYIPGLVAGVAPPLVPAIEVDTWVEDPDTLRHVNRPVAVPTHHRTILDLPEMTWRGAARYRPRASVNMVDGKRVMFLGGAESIIDRYARTQDVDWWPEEALRHADVMQALDYSGPPIDLLVTHMPPNTMVRAIWGYASTYTQQAVEAVWEHLGRPRLVCGHMHPDQIIHWHGVTCLPILGITVID